MIEEKQLNIYHLNFWSSSVINKNIQMLLRKGTSFIYFIFFFYLIHFFVTCFNWIQGPDILMLCSN